MSKPPSIAIPLDLPDVTVLRTEITPRRALIIGVESTQPTATCHQCGRMIDSFYGYDRPIRLRHLPILGMVVFIEIRPKRFRCPFCDDHPTTTQQVDWYSPRASFTKAYERQLLLTLVNSTLSDVCQKETQLLPDALEGVIERWIEAEIDWACVPAFRVCQLSPYTAPVTFVKAAPPLFGNLTPVVFRNPAPPARSLFIRYASGQRFMRTRRPYGRQEYWLYGSVSSAASAARHAQ